MVLRACTGASPGGSGGPAAVVIRPLREPGKGRWLLEQVGFPPNHAAGAHNRAPLLFFPATCNVIRPSRVAAPGPGWR